MNDFWKEVIPYLPRDDKKAFNLTCRAFYRMNHTKVTLIREIHPLLHPYLDKVKEAVFIEFTANLFRPITNTVTHIVLKESYFIEAANFNLFSHLICITFIESKLSVEPHLPLLAKNCPNLRELHIQTRFKGIESLPLFPKLEELTLPVSSKEGIESLSKLPELKSLTIILMEEKIIQLINFPCTLVIGFDLIKIFELPSHDFIKLKKALVYNVDPLRQISIVEDLLYSQATQRWLHTLLDNDFYVREKGLHLQNIYVETYLFSKILEKSPQSFLEDDFYLNESQAKLFLEFIRAKKFPPKLGYYHALIKLVLSNNYETLFQNFMEDEIVAAALKEPLDYKNNILHLMARDCRSDKETVKRAVSVFETIGIKINDENIFGYNPFEWAIKHSNWSTARLLFELSPSLLRFKAWELKLKAHSGWTYFKSIAPPLVSDNKDKNVFHVLFYYLRPLSELQKALFYLLSIDESTHPLFFMPDSLGYTPYELASHRFSTETMNELTSRIPDDFKRFLEGRRSLPLP